MSLVTEIIVVKAPIEKAFKVITDFGSYPKFLKDVSDVAVLKSGKTMAQAEFHLNLIKSIHYTLTFTLKPPTKISWKMVKGELFKKNSGSWILTQLEPKLTELIYTLDVDLGLFVPSMISKMLVANSLPATLKAFKKRIES